jgi:dolichol-phosphate mannosyltransferase
MPVLSIVIPAYNEAASMAALIERILRVPVESLGFEKELIVVDDGSRDDTANIAREFAQVRVFTQVSNQGKGKAVQRGIRESTGDYILIQDADLEYDPNDYVALLRALRSPDDCIYGSRTMGQWIANPGWSLTPGRHPEQSFGPWLAGGILTLWTFLLYGRWITDTLTSYKLYPAAIVRAMRLQTSGFETDHEITAKLIKRGCHIAEVPISHFPRTVEAGKKIKPRDGFIAVWTLLKYRVTD